MEIRGNAPITINPEVRGCALGLALTDPTNTEWELTIECGVGHAFARIGVIVTAPPSPGSGATRWIAWAFAPGVTAWRVTARVSNGLPDAVADLELAVDCRAMQTGIVPNGAFASVVA